MNKSINFFFNFYKNLLQRKRRLKSGEQIHLAKRLGFLISSGVPLLRSLGMLEKNTRSKKIKKALSFIIADVAGGELLSTSFQKNNIFTQFGIYMTEVGETSGGLGKSMGFISEEITKKRSLRQNIQGALFYPFFISIAALSLSVLLITFIFPKILPILSAVNGKLPFATRALILLSRSLSRFGLFIFVCSAAAGIAGFICFKKTPSFRRTLELILIRSIYLGNFIIYYQIANFSRTLGLLLQSNLVLTNGLELVSRHTPHSIYKKAYCNLHEALLEGEKLSFSMEKYPRLFPALYREMIEVGEATGKLSETLLYLAKLYEIELEEKTKILGNSLEPILMIFMGIVIGGVALSIILPIYQITSNLQH